ncbi:hypothetical protein [Ruegeria sp.]|uniref:hypothetical protein n=1 Tax=Ruegeria sp. TaxID=1879320 RepID=UPI003C7CDB97
MPSKVTAKAIGALPSLLFWVTTLICVLWCGITFISSSVTAHYFPMLELSDHMYVFRAWSVSIPVIVAMVILVLWHNRRPLPPRNYFFALIPLFFAFTLTFLPRVENGYEQEYWLGSQKHAIPWNFAPYNGQTQRGGSVFFIRVRGDELAPFFPQKPDASGHLILGKSTSFGFGLDAPVPKKTCDADRYNFKCEWKKGDYVYYLSSQAHSVPYDPESLLMPIVELMDRFEVEAE